MDVCYEGNSDRIHRIRQQQTFGIVMQCNHHKICFQVCLYVKYHKYHSEVNVYYYNKATNLHYRLTASHSSVSKRRRKHCRLREIAASFEVTRSGWLMELTGLFWDNENAL